MKYDEKIREVGHNVIKMCKQGEFTIREVHNLINYIEDAAREQQYRMTEKIANMRAEFEESE